MPTSPNPRISKLQSLSISSIQVVLRSSEFVIYSYGGDGDEEKLR
jgi:hypothetical protein